MKHIPTWEEYQQKLIREGVNAVLERLKQEQRQKVSECIKKFNQPIPGTTHK